MLELANSLTATSITVREMLPKIRANPNFLAAEHLEIVQSSGAESEILPPTSESLEALASGAARLRQRPGPDNALGRCLWPSQSE